MIVKKHCFVLIGRAYNRVGGGGVIHVMGTNFCLQIDGPLIQGAHKQTVYNWDFTVRYENAKL